ncbi:MAG TPA: 16S rRNA (adenine(1518)-N(6)/adenine(1519)-N(6))-dimethyltransferase RsmA [Candidatus Acidoferrum sp.]|nr:16S rRNA (adenine(1518)-N(6)/adenine(1519)-N(6))-dimethyltransferase RsmA [Candidatus Acidoferrum sp.]
MTNIIADKSLGQHWLRDDGTLKAICREAQLTKTDTVFEIGPGLGTLTRHLASQAGRVIALEFDQRLYEQLQAHPIAPNVAIAQGDILTFDLTTLPAGYKVVANVPYYITNKIIRLLLESPNPPARATLLVQKEVAERIASAPGDMSMLAVLAQFYAAVTLGPVVPAKLFTPPPKVDSQVVTLTRRVEPLFPDVSPADFFRIVKAGFSEKRKKLRNSLSGGLQMSTMQTESLLRDAHIAADARAEELSLTDWQRLLIQFEKSKKSG